MLALIPITLTEAKRLVNDHHDHNEAPEGWKFGTSIAYDGERIGAAMVGRPTGRGLDQHQDVEITRLVITEKGRYKNAASMLYGAACRMAAAGGYRNAYTYTLEDEDAASVRAAGFELDGILPPRETTDWGSTRPRYEATLLGPRKRPEEAKYRWIRHLRSERGRDSSVATSGQPGATAVGRVVTGEERQGRQPVLAVASSPIITETQWEWIEANIEPYSEYVNGKWEPQCPYGDFCSRCDAIGYCERVVSNQESEPQK